MRKNYQLLIGIIMLSLLIILMFFSEQLISDSLYEPERMIYDGETFHKAPHPPLTLDFLLGSDEDGVDLLSMVVAGTKETLVVIFAIVLLRYLIAVPLGFYTSKKSGLTNLMLGGWNYLFSSMPLLLSAILLINLPFLIYSESRTYWVIAILALIEVGRVGTIISENAHDVSKKEFVDAAIVNGGSSRTILWHHIFPFILPSIIFHFFSDMGRVTLLIAQLGIFSIFINHFIVDPDLDATIVREGYLWASMLGDARSLFLRAPWTLIVPATALFYLMITFNLLGSGLKKHFLRRDELI